MQYLHTYRAHTRPRTPRWNNPPIESISTCSPLKVFRRARSASASVIHALSVIHANDGKTSHALRSRARGRPSVSVVSHITYRYSSESSNHLSAKAQSSEEPWQSRGPRHGPAADARARAVVALEAQAERHARDVDGRFLHDVRHACGRANMVHEAVGIRGAH